MALEPAIISALAGFAIGLRYKVVILVLAICWVMAFASIVGIARAVHAWSIILVMATVGSAIQLGYLVGIVRAAVG